jgi:hypothetical protein
VTSNGGGGGGSDRGGSQLKCRFVCVEHKLYPFKCKPEKCMYLSFTGAGTLRASGLSGQPKARSSRPLRVNLLNKIR